MAEAALPPGTVIGILGGGQLGRMLAIAAARLGLRLHVYDPAPEPPAGDVAARITTAPWDDLDAVQALARSVDVVTYEFENVPAATLDAIDSIVPIRPGRQSLATSQDRAVEKTFLQAQGIAVAPWAAVDDPGSLEAAINEVGTPSILKTRTLGYDGKGQAQINDAADASGAWAQCSGVPCVLEGFVPFEREVSVIVARALDGQVICYDPAENVHRDGILHTSTVSSGVGRGIRTDAALTAGKIVSALDHVGVMGVEMFALPGNRLLVNEIAPRVHNSGHWTIEACVVDQFEQHIRAVAGWPLGDGDRHSDAVMTNLIGDDAAEWQAHAQRGGLHLYGKAEIRAGRKMGHVTVLSQKS